MKRIDVELFMDPNSEDFGMISITNDGAHIPIEMTEYDVMDYSTNETKIKRAYPAEVYFGEMLSGENFDDDEKRKTSGRNGIGAKAACIMSKKFIVEHTDPENKLKFYQVFTENGRKRSKPKITKYSSKTAYTKISFVLDYKKFDYPGLDEDFASLIKRHAYEAAMVTGLSINFTAKGVTEKIQIKSLEKYASLFFPDNKLPVHVYLKSPTGDECVICDLTRVSDAGSLFDSAGEVKAMSFINGIYTRDGGLHLDAFKNSILDRYVRMYNEKHANSAARVASKHIYPFLMFFVRAEADNPRFEEQSKHKFVALEKGKYTITLPEDDPKSVKINKEWRKSVSGVADKMVKWPFNKLLEERIAFLKDIKLKTQKESVKQGDNFFDANWAGGKKSQECTLFITEGLSAKALAMSMIGAEKKSNTCGVFAIKGKLLNIKKASIDSVIGNKEIKALNAALGLRHGVDYELPENRKTLRYGRVEIMTDADDDGIHITGLILVFYSQWPSLFKIGFINSFSTAVVIYRDRSETKLFYSNPEFKKWVEDSNINLKSNKLKYLKGLGSHESEDILEYEDRHVISFVQDEDASKSLELGFGGDNSSKRKEYILAGLKRTEFPYRSQGVMRITDFINDLFIHYCITTLSRAIPDLYDGLKVSGRKILYGMRLKGYEGASKPNIGCEILTGGIKEVTAYHHGNVSLYGTIVGMAQGFVGSNNIPFLVAGGQMGSRFDGGKKTFSAPRYTSSKLEDVFSLIFRKEDDPILEYNYEGDLRIEPKRTYPILPGAFINGASGQATGWSSFIPSLNPYTMIKWIKTWLTEGDTYPELVPWYRDYKGTSEIVMDDDGTPVWKRRGILTKTAKNTWEITEIPIGIWPKKFEKHLDKLIEKGMGSDGTKCFTKKYDSNPTMNTVSWTLHTTSEFTPDIDTPGNMAVLAKSTRLSNMILLNKEGIPTRYNTFKDVFYAWCPERLEFYGKRKEYYLKEYAKEINKLENKLKFVTGVKNEELKLNKPKDEVEADLEEYGLDRLAEDGFTSADGKPTSSYKYLLSMPMSSITKERVEKLEKELEDIKAKRDEYESQLPGDLWIKDLDELEAYLKVWLPKRSKSDDVQKRGKRTKGITRSKSTKA